MRVKLLLAAAVAIALVWALASERTRRRAEESAVQARSEAGGLRGEIARLRSGGAVPPAAPQTAPAAPPQFKAAPQQRIGPEAGALDAKSAADLKQKLAAAQGVVARLEERIWQSEAQLVQLQAETKRLTGAEAEASEKLSDANRVITALEAELSGKNDRLRQLDAANQKLRKEASVAAAKNNEAAKVDAELQEIYRRRELSLRNILQRYREVTEQYRALAGVMENRKPDASGPSVTPDLSRIQSVISMAEEDLRQLNSLDAQAARIQSKLAGK